MDDTLVVESDTSDESSDATVLGSSTNLIPSSLQLRCSRSSSTHSRRPEMIERILSYRQSGDDIDYFVKLVARPYRSCRWIRRRDICQSADADRFFKEYHEQVHFPPPEPYYDPLYNEMDRIVGHHCHRNGSITYLVKWKHLHYDSCTWENASCFSDPEIIQFFEANSIGFSIEFIHPLAETYCKLSASPKFKNEHELSGAELECLNWVIFRWYQQDNCILTGETGLSTTIQIITFLHFIHNIHKCQGPFLIISPAAKLHDWELSVGEWTNLRVIVYKGNKKALDIIQDYELYFIDEHKPKFDVIITSCDLLMANLRIFSEFHFHVLIVDESRQLRRTHSSLGKLSSDFRIFVSDRPVANTKDEQQSVLNFVHPGEVSDVDFTDIDEMRRSLEPYIFRSIPNPEISGKEEVVIECSMTNAQRQLYRLILERNASFLIRGTNLVNIAMELRTVCQHPYLVKAGEENIDNTFKSLIVSSGKMIVLDKLLEKLKEDCQRVVILSPMIRLLNIIGDYLEGVGISYQRLDGSEMCYDAEAFVFLVSRPDQPFEGTDTVIIFDSSVRPNCIKSCGKVYRFIAKGSFECEISELATKRIGVDQRTSGKELEKLLRLSAYQILNFREDESCDIDEILSHPVMAGSNLGVDIDVDDSDFWPNLLELPITGDFDREDDDILIQSDDCEVCPAVLPDLETSGDDRSVGQWRDFELAQLEKLLFWYGWGRWDDAHSLCGLNRDVPDMRVAGRAVLGWLINTAKELHDFLFAISLLDGAYSTEFDPTFDTREVSETLDAEFMKHAILVHPQFAQLSEGKGKWLKRLEIVTVVTMAVERAHRNLREIVVPELAAALPADWWTENDDRCLLYGTWKYGFSSYCRFKEDESILLSSNTLPPEPALTQRLRSLAFGIRRIYVIAPTSDRLPRLWTQRENGKVLKCLFRAGVPLKPDGSHDWVKLRECCRLADRTAEEIEKLVIGMMEIADFNEQHPGCDQDDDDDGRDDDGRDNGDDDDDNDGDADDSENGDDEKTLGGITARRIRDRFNSLTRLRRLFMKFTEQEISEYFSFLPRRVGRPLRWTTPMEFLFFKEVCSRGWKVSGEILKMREFEGVFRGRPPSYLRRESKTIRRLNFILTFIEQNALETLRERGKPKPPRGRGVPANCLNPAPEICCDGNGALILPIGIAPTAFVIDLGRIVTDRPDFHSERYIFPAGFKSSRLYWSTINPSEKVWYTSEIVDTGDAMPLFRVTMDDHPEISIDGNSPFSPWQSIARRVAEARGQSGRGAALRERFGLSSPVICYLIQQMAGAETCVNYLMRSFAPPRIRVRKLNQPGAASLANPVDPEDAPSADLLPIPKIPYDENGAPSLPIWLSPTMFVSDLGHIVTDRPGFHTDRYIYPAGFKSTRRYWSTINPSQKVSYTSEIVDTGADVPLFRVTMKDHPEISFDGNSPSSPWNLIAKLVLEASGGKHGTRFLPGPDYIGLSSPVIRYLIQRMEGADKSLESEILRLA